VTWCVVLVCAEGFDPLVMAHWGWKEVMSFSGRWGCVYGGEVWNVDLGLGIRDLEA
jgi:hypothetical protein